MTKGQNLTSVQIRSTTTELIVVIAPESTMKSAVDNITFTVWDGCYLTTGWFLVNIINLPPYFNQTPSNMTFTVGKTMNSSLPAVADPEGFGPFVSLLEPLPSYLTFDNNALLISSTAGFDVPATLMSLTV